jgi:hypothetical protein
MKEKISIQKTLYLKKVEKLLKRQADIIEISSIHSAFSRHRSSLETAKLLNRTRRDRVDRENNFA